MNIYHYDRDTKEFTGMGEAEPNQVGRGFLIPAFATEIKPNECTQFEKPFFNGDKWEIRPHYKGLAQVDLSNKIVSIVNYFGDIQLGFQHVDDETAKEITANPDRYVIEKNKLMKLSSTRYNKYLQDKKNQNRIAEIKHEQDKLDLKYIRAFSEGGEKETGLLWTDYYKNEILLLRNELQELENIELQ